MNAKKHKIWIFAVVAALLLVLVGGAPLAAARDGGMPANTRPTTGVEDTAAVPPAGLTSAEWRSVLEQTPRAALQASGSEPKFSQVAKLVAGDGAPGDFFGLSADVSGDTAVVGAPHEDDDTGAVYLFVRNEGGKDNWGEVVKLIASDGVPGDRFGNSVAIDGDTVIVGAEGALSLQGVAYLFVRNEGGQDNWGEVAKLIASDGAAEDRFGCSVAASGDRVLVGAPQDDAWTGAAYLFARNKDGEDTWGEVVKLTASDGQDNDLFGVSVAIDNDTLAIGVWGDDGHRGSAYVFERNQDGDDNWGQVRKLPVGGLEPQDWFGFAVDISGDLVVAGAWGDDDLGATAGAAYLFRRNEGGLDNWGQVAKLTADDGGPEEYFGVSVSIDGDTVAAGAYGHQDYQGAAYLFRRNKGGADNWGQTAKLTAADGVAGDHLGDSLAISGNTLVAGACAADSHQGAAYLFQRRGNVWQQQIKVTADDGQEEDNFGKAVAMDGDWLVVGALYGNDPVPNAGTVYLFERNEGGADAWGQVIELFAPGGADHDGFGYSVAISGDIIVVGVPFDDDLGYNSGSAHVFARNQGGADAWGQVTQLFASDGGEQHCFGLSVSVNGDIIVVGAPFADDDQGAVYLFERNEGGPDNWGQIAKRPADDGDPGDYLGYSVAIQGDTVAAGAPNDEENGVSAGSAYLFERNEGGPDNWGQVTKIIGDDVADWSLFGFSVAIRDDTLVVGAPRLDLAPPGPGSAYVFERNTGGADNWGQVAKLTPEVSMDYDYFGWSVSLCCDRIAASAFGMDAERGAAYVFERNAGCTDVWGQTAKLIAADGESGDWFGFSVALTADRVASGARYDDAYQGSAYLFYLAAQPDLSLLKTVDPPTPLSPGQPLTYTLTFSNAGLDIAHDIVLTDVVPLSVTVTGVVSRGVAITDTGALPPYVWQVADLMPEEGGVLTITALLNAALPDGHSFANTASITTPTDLDITNNYSSVLVTVANAPAITVTKTADVAVARAGQTLTYTYRVTNTGNVPLSGLLAHDDRLGAVPLAVTSLAPDQGTAGALTYTVLSGDLPGPLLNIVIVTGTLPTGADVTASAGASVRLPWCQIYLPLIYSDVPAAE
jgi:uncharacterized repeat protein (TIGR01451 family)